MNAAAKPEAIDRETLRIWSRRSDLPGLIHLARHVGTLLLTGTAIWLARGTLWLWPAMFVHGVVLIFLFTPLHECIHRTAFKTRALNESVAFVVGALILLPREYFRAFHFAHHRFTQDPARDPELASPKPASLRQWLWQVSGLPYWIAQLRGTVAHAFGRASESFYKDERQRRAVIVEARIVLAIYALVLLGSIATASTAALAYWVVPALLGQPALRLYLMAEHGLCPLSPDMLENTRTTYTNALVRALAWNMPYHAEHHAYPAVPFHRLPEVNRVIAPRLKSTSTGYIAVHRKILRSYAD
ncbi:fatty acid desaturase [Dongia sedimenti]|uniref:Fatty acid desaturase n=1 Tax=Dongia sedimenti TaxID=3064282 RepID=A0ABU0YR88_9PROT|nr:fatty acid desaturase [Rhodospirillaceae bacterium R-7]